MRLVLEVTDLLIDATLEAVFGDKTVGKSIEFIYNG